MLWGKLVRIAPILVLLGALAGCAANESTKSKIDDDVKGRFPVYGNWCGPSHPKHSGTNEPEPIDEVDGMCEAHDKCYSREGYANCECDFDLIGEIHLQKHYTSEQAESAAKAIYAAFLVWPCAGPEMALMPAMVFANDRGDIIYMEDGSLTVNPLAIPFLLLYAIFESIFGDNDEEVVEKSANK